ncbi:MAG TPA: AbrB family transcriptional regulator [Clostridiaceae bacterium]|nr:AbrB family transcriptional regulator [Clostridiaceae bacterium]
MFWVIITFLVACIGSFIFYRLKIAAGILVGAMFFVAAFNILTDLAYFPMYAKVFAQIISGAFIGVGINRYNIIQLKQIFKPAIVLVLSMLVINILVGMSIYALSSLDLITSLFCSVPGGVSDMAIISHDMGADTSKVAVLQLVRLVSTLALFPAIITRVEKYMNGLSKASANSSNNGEIVNSDNNDINGSNDTDNNSNVNSRDNDNRVSDKDAGYSNKGKILNKDMIKKISVTFTISVTSGVIGYYTGLPAGTLLFSVIGVSSFNVATGKACLPLPVKRFAQIVAGAFIGTNFVREDLLQLKLLIFPAIILIIGYIILCILLGILISRMFKIDVATSLFSSTPAGASDMALIASDLGVNSPKVALLQIARLVGVIAISPWVIKLIQAVYDLIII